MKKIVLSLILLVGISFAQTNQQTNKNYSNGGKKQKTYKKPKTIFPFIGLGFGANNLTEELKEPGYYPLTVKESLSQKSLLGGVIIKSRYTNRVYKLTGYYSYYNKENMRTYGLMYDYMFRGHSSFQPLLGAGLSLDTMSSSEVKLTYVNLLAQVGFDYFVTKNIFTDLVFKVASGYGSSSPSIDADITLVNLGYQFSLNYKF